MFLGVNDFLEKGFCDMGIVVVSIFLRKYGSSGVYICLYFLEVCVYVYFCRDRVVVRMSLCLEVVIEVLGFGGESCK